MGNTSLPVQRLSSPCWRRAQLGAQGGLALKGRGKGGSASLVFLVNLSIEQSISQRRKHKIIGYTALSCMRAWK